MIFFYLCWRAFFFFVQIFFSYQGIYKQNVAFLLLSDYRNLLIQPALISSVQKGRSKSLKTKMPPPIHPTQVNNNCFLPFCMSLSFLQVMMIISLVLQLAKVYLSFPLACRHLQNRKPVLISWQHLPEISQPPSHIGTIIILEDFSFKDQQPSLEKAVVDPNLG